MKPLFFAVCAALLFSAGANTASGQNSRFEEDLGRELYNQSCRICHERPSLRSRLIYAPELSRESLGASSDALRAMIMEGSTRMPGFKQMLSKDEIGSLVAFIKSVAPPSNPLPAAVKQ